MPKKRAVSNKNRPRSPIKRLCWFLLIGLPFLVAAVDRATPVVRAVEKVGPAVVNVSSRHEIRHRASPFSGVAADPLFEQFFRDFFDPGTPRGYSRSSLGSGVIIDGERGFILTNAHVMENAGAITVTLKDEREFEASVVGADPDSDLAVLKIQSPEPLPSVAMGRSDDLMIGETVIAIGNPFGFSHTVTTGVISAVNRSLRTRDRVFHEFIQIDASINPGNSGGPLLNINGELIGINTAIYAKAQGIGFAIPICKARRIVSDLIAYGEVIPAWFGLFVHGLDDGTARYLAVPNGQGLVVHAVVPDSPAARAGVREGDVLLSLGGRRMGTPADYRQRLRDYADGSRTEMVLWRKKRRLTVPVTAAVFPLSLASKLGLDLFGVTVETLAPAHRRRFQVLAETGAVITQVDARSQLGRVGAKPGDVIRRMDDLPIETAEDFNKAVVKYRLKPSVVVLIQRQDQGYYITVRLLGG
ncbi:MAG: trypsin-like peptidase domain-containing protein [Desulfobacterales bacterium]|nr:trypsin-like peptidase domain-containing protein [Desulfobacterales bacterium]